MNRQITEEKADIRCTLQGAYYQARAREIVNVKLIYA